MLLLQNIIKNPTFRILVTFWQKCKDNRINLYY